MSEFDSEYEELARRAARLGYVVVPEETLKKAADGFDTAMTALNHIRQQYDELQAYLVEIIMISRNTNPEVQEKFRKWLHGGSPEV